MERSRSKIDGSEMPDQKQMSSVQEWYAEHFHKELGNSSIHTCRLLTTCSKIKHSQGISGSEFINVNIFALTYILNYYMMHYDSALRLVHHDHMTSQ